MELSLFLHARTLYWMKISGQSFYCKALKVRWLHNMILGKDKNVTLPYYTGDSMENFKLDLQFLSIKCFVLYLRALTHSVPFSLPFSLHMTDSFYQSHLGLMSPPIEAYLRDTLQKRLPYSSLWFFSIVTQISLIIFYNYTPIYCLYVYSISHHELQDPAQRGLWSTCSVPKVHPSVTEYLVIIASVNR